MGTKIILLIVCILKVMPHYCSKPTGNHSDARHNLLSFKITDDYAMDTTLHEKPFEKEDIGCVFYESMAMPVYEPRPDYPETAAQSMIEGDVWVKAFVDSTGRVIYAYIAKSNNVIFNKTSLQAMVQWKFSPAVLQDKRIGVWVAYPFKYRHGKIKH